MRLRSNFARALSKNRTARAVSWCILPLLGLGLVVGCGGVENELGRKAISGNVTLDGQPLDQGSIAFEPLSDTGVRSGATISDGAYSVEELKGLPPGEYRVRINSAESTGPEPEGAPGEPTQNVSKERVPATWNTRSEEKVTITDDGDNTFNFDIKTGG